MRYPQWIFLENYRTPCKLCLENALPLDPDHDAPPLDVIHEHPGIWVACRPTDTGLEITARPEWETGPPPPGWTP